MSGVCVFGAGAIGGLLAAKPEAADTPVSVVARGPHPAAMRERDRVLRSEGERTTTRPRAVSDPAEIGPQDSPFPTPKAPSLEAVLPRLRPLVGPGTTVVTAVDGVPWWYTHGPPEPFGGRRRWTRTARRGRRCRRRGCRVVWSIPPPRSPNPA